MVNLDLGFGALVPRIEQLLQLVGCRRMKIRFNFVGSSLPAYVSCPETLYPKTALKFTFPRSALLTVILKSPFVLVMLELAGIKRELGELGPVRDRVAV